MTRRSTCPPVAALLLMLAAGPLAAQQTLITVRVVVVDGATGSPIGGAYVGVRDSNRGSPTNTEGGFLLRDVPAGSIIEVTQLGYAAWIQQVETGAALRIALTVNPIVMDRLEVVTDRLADRSRASAVSARS